MVTIRVTEEEIELTGFDGGGSPTYNVAGKPLSGFIVSYDEEGKILDEAEYQNGYIEGLQRDFYTNGQLQTEYSIKNNQLNGSYREWSEDGTLVSESIWELGKRIS